MDVKKCTICNIIIDEDIYKKMYVKTATILLEKNILKTRSLKTIIMKRK